MCPECSKLYAQLSDLNARLATQTRGLTALAPTEIERYQDVQAELTQTRQTCTQVRRELQQHRAHHEALFANGLTP